MRAQAVIIISGDHLPPHLYSKGHVRVPSFDFFKHKIISETECFPIITCQNLQRLWYFVVNVILNDVYP